MRLFPDNEGEHSGGRLGLTVTRSRGEDSANGSVTLKRLSFIVGKTKHISLPLPELNANEQNGEILHDGAFCENTVCADQFS